jgi:hypothetical protein
MNSFFHRTLGSLGLVRAGARQVYGRYFGKLEHIPGTAQEVCAEIVDRTWNGTFYRTSLGHYDFFWMRDFGTVAESLTKLGHKHNVHATLRWALEHFMQVNHVTLCIDKAGHTFNAPDQHSIDALPWLMHSLAVSEYPLNRKERTFLNERVQNYTHRYIDSMTGHLKKSLYAELRDAVFYDRSAYSYTLVGRLSAAIDELGLDPFPFPVGRYAEALLEYYWNGSYFKADSKMDAFSAECALMPFFLGVVNDKSLADQTFDYINEEKYNEPYPLKYSKKAGKLRYRFGMGPVAMPNYTGDTIWTWHATFYLHLLRRYHRPEYKKQYEKFAELIERHGNYPELVNPDGSWYYAPFYRSDPGMVWAALFLELPNPSS